MPPKIAAARNFFIVQYADYAFKSVLFALVFFMPLFFAPWTLTPGDFNKQALLLLLIVIALALWMVKTLASLKFSFRASFLHIGVAALLLAVSLSTIFSTASYASFWGSGQIFSRAFATIFALVVFYFLVSNDFSEQEIVMGFYVLAISSALALFFGILQLLGRHIMPLGVASSNMFNTVGSVGNFGFFAVSLLAACMVLFMGARKWWRFLFGATMLLAFLALVLINYRFLWVLCCVASLVVLVSWAIKRDMFDLRWMFLPIFFFIVSLFFATAAPHIVWLPQIQPEVSLPFAGAMQITAQSVKSSWALGSGPATFLYDFSKYQDSTINQTPLWNVVFHSGASRVLTDVAEIGILGGLAWLALLILPLFYAGGRIIFEKSRRELQTTRFILAAAALLFVQAVGYFLFTGNLTLDFLFFFSLAATAGLLAKNTKTYSLKPSSLVSLGVIFLLALVVIFSAGVMVLEGQHYLADLQYQKGLALFDQGKKNEALAFVKKAATATGFDGYFNRAALFSLSALQDELAAPTNIDPANEKERLQPLISDAVNYVNAAIKINPNNYENWSTKAYVCEGLMGLLDSAPACAIDSYQKAAALKPNSPEAYYRIGILYYQDKNWAKAGENFQLALALVPSYANALYYSGLAYDQQGDHASALRQFSLLLSLDANKQDIQKIIDNINAGKPALGGQTNQSAPPDAPATTPKTNTP